MVYCIPPPHDKRGFTVYIWIQVTGSRLQELEQERLQMQEERELVSRQQDAMRETAGTRELCTYPRRPVTKKSPRVPKSALYGPRVFFFKNYYVLFFFCTITPLVIKKVSQCEHFLFWRVSIEQISKRGAKKINKNSIFHAFCIFARCDDYFTNCWILKSNEKSCTTHPTTFFLLRCSYLWH